RRRSTAPACPFSLSCAVRAAPGGRAGGWRPAGLRPAARGRARPPAGAPRPPREVAAPVCWLGDPPGHASARLSLKHGTRPVPARLDAIEGRIDFETLEWPAAEELRL